MPNRNGLQKCNVGGVTHALCEVRSWRASGPKIKNGFGEGSIGFSVSTGEEGSGGLAF